MQSGTVRHQVNDSPDCLTEGRLIYMKSSQSEVAQVLCDLLGYCRKRLDEPSLSDLSKVMPLEDREELITVSGHLLVEYLKQIIGYLVKSKIRMENKLVELSKPEEDQMNEYEGMLQNLEAECRQHIRIEQQLKICAETAQEKQELAEKELIASENNRRNLEEELQASTHRYEETNHARKDLESKINSLTQRIKEMEEQIVVQSSSDRLSSAGPSSRSNSLFGSKLISKAPLPYVVSSHTKQSQSVTEHDFQQHINLPFHIPGSSTIDNGWSKRLVPDTNAVAAAAAAAMTNGKATTKRSQRSISQIGQTYTDPVCSSTSSSSIVYREAMRQLEHHGEGLIEKKQSQQYSDQIGTSAVFGGGQQQQQLLRMASGKTSHHSSNNQSESYPSQALAYLLGTSQIRPDKRSSNQSKEEMKKTSDRSIQENSKQNISRVGSTNASLVKPTAGSTVLSGQSQSGSMKRIQQQQLLLKQMQSQAVLSKIHQKLTGGIAATQHIRQQTQPQPHPPVQQPQSTISPYINSSSVLVTTTQPSSSSTSALSRSKSRMRFKDIYYEPTAENKQRTQTQQQEENGYFHAKMNEKDPSPFKIRTETLRSHSLDACTKQKDKSFTQK